MKNFNVFQASAGSGKTFTLVKEYLKLCLRDEKSVDNYKHILAVTFTNKAAGEMKARILSDLLMISQNTNTVRDGSLEDQLLREIDGITPEQLRENSKKLFHRIIHDYSNLCLSTIDSFTQKLARSFPKELNLPYQYGIIIDNDEITENVIQLLGDEIGEQNEYITKILVDYVVQNIEDEKIWRVEKQLSRFIHNILKEDSFLLDDNKTIIDEKNYATIRTEINQRIYAIENKINIFIKQINDWKNKYNLSEDDCYQGSKSLPSFVKSLKNKEYKTVNSYTLKIAQDPELWPSAKGKTRHSNKLLEIGNDLHSFLPDFIQYYDKSHVIIRVLKLLRNQLSLLALQSQINTKMDEYIVLEQQVHISEFNKRIAQILSSCSVPFIYERMGEKYRHIFIDEFQDTSILQWRNFLPLISNSLAEGNTNLIVGDGKQAIYRFRSGEVEQIVNIPFIYNKPDDPQYDWYENTLIENFNFHNLNTNYRSFKKIVEFNNAFYEYCHQRLTDERLQKVYKSYDSHKTISIEQNVNKKQDGLVQIDIFDQDEAKKNGGTEESIIQRVLSLVKTLHKHYNYKDITILCRAKEKGSRIAQYLNKENIPVMSADSILIGSSNEVQLIINTLAFLNSRNNPITIANILYFKKLTSDSQFSGKLNGLFHDVTKIAEGKTELEPSIGLASHFFDTLLSKAYSLYDLCSALIRAYNLDSITDPFLAFFLEDVQTWQGANNLGIKDFIEYWNRQGCTKSIYASEQIDAVNIMTVHKAKGLAFKVVIFPYAATKLTSSKITKSQQWLDMSALEIPDIKNALMKVTKTDLSNTPWEYTYTEENNKTELDNLNISYVATTRPIEQLYILTDNKNAKDNLWLGFLADKEDAKVANEDLYCTYQFGSYPTNNIKKSSPPIININSKSATWDNKVEVDPDPTMFWKSDSDAMRPQDWGNLVHSILAKIDNIDNADAILTPFVIDGTLDHLQAKELKEKFISMSETDIIKPAFSKEALIKNECSLYSNDYGILRPDRYAELPDKIFIIDYKTGAEREEHHQQLQRYASVLKTMTNKPITAYLFYIQPNQDAHLVEVKL